MTQILAVQPRVDVGKPWRQLMGQLLTACGLDPLPSRSAVCLAGTTLVADIVNPDPEIANYNRYAIGDVVPAWGPTYGPHGSVSQAYDLFLHAIDPVKCGANGDPNLINRLNVAAAAVSANQENYTSVQDKALTRYATWQKATGDKSGFADWAARNYPVLAAAYSSLMGALSEYQNLLTKQHGFAYEELMQAIQRVHAARDVNLESKMNMAVKAGSVAPPGSVSTLPGQTPPAPLKDQVSFQRPRYDIRGFESAFPEWQQNSINNNQPYKFQFSDDQGDISWERFGWSAEAHAGFGWGFVNAEVEASAEGHSERYTIDHSGSSVEMSFAGLGKFQISNDPWFDPAIVDQLGNKVRDDVAPFFGEQGTLGLVPTTAILAFGPQIRLKLQASAYNEAKSQFSLNVNASLNVGPFRLGGARYSAAGSRDEVHWLDESAEIVIGPIKSRLPLLLGVVCAKRDLGPAA